jgi:hypothetical protein
VVQDEAIEDPAQRHLRRPDAVGAVDLTGDRCTQRGDALDELARGISDLERGLDLLTFGQQRIEVNLGLLLVRLRRSDDALPLVQRQSFAQQRVAPGQLRSASASRSRLRAQASRSSSSASRRSRSPVSCATVPSTSSATVAKYSMTALSMAWRGTSGCLQSTAPERRPMQR